MDVKNDYKIFQESNYVKGIVIVVHGMCEHRGRYEYFANKISEQGYIVLTYDQQGHGMAAKSNDQLGYFGKDKGWFCLIDDLDIIVNQLKLKYPGLPIILFGHSMGSQVVRSYLKTNSNKVVGAILCGTVAYQPMSHVGLLLAKIFAKFNDKGRSEFLRKLFEGSFNRKIKNAKGSNDWVSANPQNLIDYNNDELCGFTFTNRAYVNLLFGNIYMHSLDDCKDINKNLKILSISGSDDPCVGYEKGLNNTIKALNKIGFKDIEKKVYKGLRHEVLNEIEKDDVINDVIEWLNMLNL